jgi:hypothetical protein
VPPSLLSALLAATAIGASARRGAGGRRGGVPAGGPGPADRVDVRSRGETCRNE